MSRFLGIQGKLMLFSLGGTLLLSLCFLAIVNFDYRRNISQELERRGNILSLGIAMSTQKALLTDNPARIKSIVDLYKTVDPDIVYVVIMNSRGEIVYHTFEKGFPQDLEKVMRAHTRHSVLLSTDEGYVRNIPSRIFGGDAGTAHLGLSEARVRRQMSANLRKLILIVLLIGAGGILAISLLSRSVTVPINRVIRAAERFGAGDFAHRLDTRSGDETGRLAVAFNTMAEQIDHHQRDMLQAEKLAAVGRLASGIAHEINNPLMGIQNACRYLKEQHNFTGTSAEYMDLILESLTRIERIGRGLLISLHPAGTAARDFKVADVMNRALALTEHLAQKKGVTVTWNFANDIPRMHGNPERFEQLALNLALNALDAAPANGEVSVSLSAEHGTDFVVFKVRDNGPGIPAHVREHIFEPFFTTKEPGVGTGLGLYVCHEIVREMNGRILVDSEPGQGAVFTVYVPTHDQKHDGLHHEHPSG